MTFVASVPTNPARRGVGVERISKELIIQPVLEPPYVGDSGVVLLDAACGFTPVCTSLSAIRAARGSE